MRDGAPAGMRGHTAAELRYGADRKMSKHKPARVEEVEILGWTATASGARKKPLTKSSRRQELRSERVHLRHIPTGAEGYVDIPPGHYSKSEMQRLREETKRRFLIQLGVIE